MFDFFKKHSGEIAVSLAVVTVAIPGVIVVAHVSAGVAAAAACTAIVTGGGSLFSGGYALRIRVEAVELQEREHSKQDAENTQLMEVEKDKDATVVQEHNLLNDVQHKLNSKVNQHDLQFTSITKRQDSLETTRATDQIISARKDKEVERRLLELEGLVTNGIFSNNPDNNTRRRRAANDDNEDGHRGRHRRQGPGQL
jgi:hypothetical protein